VDHPDRSDARTAARTSAKTGAFRQARRPRRINQRFLTLLSGLTTKVQAIDHLDQLLTTAPAGPAGWIIPIDPMLAPLREHPRKQALFAKLAARAA
jgi:hypothetical protein